MDGYPQPEGVLESLGVPPDMAGKIRRRGVMPALLNTGQDEYFGSKLDSGTPRLAQLMNQDGNGQADPGMSAPESTYSANGQTRLVDHVQEHRIEDDKSRSPYGDAEAMTPATQATPDRPVPDVSGLSPSGRPPLRDAMNAAVPPSPDMSGLGLRDAVMDSPLSRPSVLPPTPLTEAQANMAKAEQPSGVSRLMTKAQGIHNPLLRGLGELGAGLARGVDVAGSIFAPNAAAMIPGSTLNHAVRRFAAQRQLAQAQGPPPEHMDSDQGPIEFNRQTQQWEPITIGGNPVGSKSSLESTATGRRQLSDQYGLSSEDRIRYILTGQMPAVGQQPEHMDTDQGPLQFNRQTHQWEPILVGGQRVGPKSTKPDSLDQQYDAAVSSGDQATAKRLLKEMSDIAAAKQPPQQPQREPQQLAIGPDGRVMNLRPGMTVQPGTVTASQYGPEQTKLNQQGATATATVHSFTRYQDSFRASAPNSPKTTAGRCKS